MKKKLLITLRHPGPVQAIVPFFPYLAELYDVAVLAADSALPFIYERYHLEAYNTAIYYRLNGKWRLSEHSLPLNQDSSEFSSVDEEGFSELISSMIDIIQKIKPDVILRTTPAIHYGVDEAVSEAVKESGVPCRRLCYQDYYGCGHVLKNFDGTILTLDKEASQLLFREGIGSIPIGWLSMLNFLRYPDYNTVREKIRNKIQADSNQMILLYCMTASGDIDAELEIFSRFLSSVQKQRLFIKMHPRNTKEEKQRYLDLLNDTPYETVDTLRYEEVLAFPDYIISPASAVNVDALAYQICNGLHALKTVSVYTEGTNTCRIIQRATGYSSLAPGRRGNGSIIADERFRGIAFNQPEVDLQRRLYQEAKKFLGGNVNEIIATFMKYLEGA